MWPCVPVFVLVWMVNSLDGHYTDQWGVCIEGGKEKADEIAQRHGFINKGLIVSDCYHFIHPKVRKRSIEPHTVYHQHLVNEPDVIWAEQQVAKSRVKRDYINSKSRSTQKRSKFMWNDARWTQMWYLNRGSGLDMNVESAWNDVITGKGVVVTILDDGLEKDHPDLVKNYDPLASYDVNSHDEDPMPRYDLVDSNRHGTRCAGEVAAVANNSFCAVGIAYNANVGGVRMLDGDVTDAVEARSLSLNAQHIDIYSASWGPDDDGKTVDGPGELALRAFTEGVTKGRGGKGSIFVWASGNGGRDFDNCNCDGYTNSIWTLSISSATEGGHVPWYSEACSSTLATTYSSGATGEKQIITTDLHHSCTSSHTGTSASAPLAAAICALALEANKKLTWRDMQHIVVRTARPSNLLSKDWVTNGVGRNVSHSFGYGLMDAGAMVRLAKVWKTVPDQHKCEVPAPDVEKFIPAKSQVTLKIHVASCPGVNYLEHVQAKVTLTSSRRGDLQIYLTSPSGTKAALLARRPHDNSRAGFQLWPFMSVHSWGENPLGAWTLEVHNEGRYAGTLNNWNLVLHGTETTPETMNVEELKSDNVPQETIRDSGCVKMSTNGLCLECSAGLMVLHGVCVTSCPDNFFVVWDGSNNKTFGGTCVPCHYLCKQCSGPGDHQCTECHADASHWPSGDQIYCAPKVVLNALSQGSKWDAALIGALCLTLIALTVLSSFLLWSACVEKKMRETWLHSDSEKTNGIDGFSRVPLEETSGSEGEE